MQMNKSAITIYVAIILIILLSFAIYASKKSKSKWTTKQLTLGAIFMSLAYLLSFIKIYQLPQGGSITLFSMLPIMLYGYIYGPSKGLTVGICYGVLQIMQDFYIVHPAQLFMDYIFAFGVLGLVGLGIFKKNLIIGICFAGFLRYLFHVISGMIFFAEYAQGQPVLVYSSIYNFAILIDTALCIIVVCIPNFKQAIKKLT